MCLGSNVGLLLECAPRQSGFYVKSEVIAAVQLQKNVLDGRNRALNRWVSAYYNEDLVGEVASSDASFRRYFRYFPSALSGGSVVAMDAPPEKENSEPFVRIAAQLAAGDIHVPEIFAADLAQGFLLLSDLGHQTWLNLLTDDNADVYFTAALDVLVAIQQVPTAGLPHYDQSLIAHELALFPDWYLKHERQLAMPEQIVADWSQLCELLTANMLSQPQVFVHRDFMPRNLMQSNPNPGVIDFQDAVAGPIAYDPICLFRDAFLSWPDNRVNRWLQHYHDKACRVGLPLPAAYHEFKKVADLTGVHRHLKVIGIFARIYHRDGKAHYLSDVPRFFDYLKAQADEYSELAPLSRLLQWLDGCQ